MKKFLALALAFTFLFASAALADVVKVGTNPEFAPFEFIGDDGQPTGIDMDLIKAVFEKVDPSIEVQIEIMTFDALIPALAVNDIHCIIAGMTITEERKQSVLFSDPYFSATQKIIVKEGSEIKSEADLVGKKIGVQLGTTGDLYVTDNIEGAQLERFDKALDPVIELGNGKLDAVVLDEAPSALYAAQVTGVTILEDRLSDEQYGIAFPMESTELVEKVNAALKTMTEDGSIQAIFDSYSMTGE